jgi:hypothetical protein
MPITKANPISRLTSDGFFAAICSNCSFDSASNEYGEFVFILPVLINDEVNCVPKNRTFGKVIYAGRSEGLRLHTRIPQIIGGKTS